MMFSVFAVVSLSLCQELFLHSYILLFTESRRKDIANFISYFNYYGLQYALCRLRRLHQFHSFYSQDQTKCRYTK